MFGAYDDHTPGAFGPPASWCIPRLFLVWYVPSSLGGGLCHFSTVHSRHDIRIRVKEVATLVERYGSVTLVVQDGLGDAVEDEGRVLIRDIGTAGGRLRRAFLGGWRMWRTVQEIRPTVAHFHDPELIPVGLALKLSGSSVVYDVHEDLPRQILSKHWIAAWLRRPVAALATPSIADRFPKAKTITIQNFPLLDELWSVDGRAFTERPAIAAYVGGITGIRGAREMVRAIDHVPERHELRLVMAGTFAPAALGEELAAQPGWAKTNAVGFLPRPDLARLLSDFSSICPRASQWSRRTSRSGDRLWKEPGAACWSTHSTPGRLPKLWNGCWTIRRRPRPWVGAAVALWNPVSTGRRSPKNC